MPTLNQDGVQISYDVHGQGKGHPLLLTHGYGASRRMWEVNLPALSRGRRAISWDMRGHGSSDAPADPGRYSHAACIEDMARLLDELGAREAVLCGMSLGGFLSLAFCLRFPDRVRGLALVDTGPGFRDDAARERWNHRAGGLADQLEREGLAALTSQEMRTAQHVHGAVGLAQAARGMLVQTDGTVLRSLGEIAAPTLIVVGALDTQFLRAADVMEERIPSARKVVLDGAGHAANVDAPEEFNRTVSGFLQEIDQALARPGAS